MSIVCKTSGGIEHNHSCTKTKGMDLTVVLVFIVVFLISYVVVSKPKNLPPGPMGLPLFGSLFLLRKFRERRPHLVLLDEAKKYGNVMSFSLGKRLFVVLSGYDVIHQALVRQAEEFSDRPVFIQLDKGIKDAPEFQDRPEFVEKMKTGGIVLQHYGHTWRKLRRFTLQSLRDFGVGKTSIEEKIFTEIEAVSKAFEASQGRPIATTNYIQKLIGNVLYGIVFGKRYDFDDPQFARIRKTMATFFTQGGTFSAGRILPKFLAKLFSKKDVVTEKKTIEAFREVKKYIADEIKEHEETFDNDNIRDFVDIYLQTQQDTGVEKGDIDMANMFRAIVDLFLAGTETTYTTLDWALLYMSEFPDIQARCQEELQEIFGNKPVEYADRGKMPYLEATLMEIQRVAMILPISVLHSTPRDTTLCGYDIPAGASVMISLYSAHNDPKYWKQPEKFLPERFLDKSGKLVNNEAFIPFSTGPRICLGEPLAKMELFLVFSNLLQRFTFAREDPEVPQSLEPKLYYLTSSPLDYKLRVYKN